MLMVHIRLLLILFFSIAVFLDLKALNMWDGLLNGLNDDEDEIRKMLCWIIGTAIQNNTTALSHVLMMPWNL